MGSWCIATSLLGAALSGCSGGGGDGLDLTIDGSYVQKQRLGGTTKYKNSSTTATLTAQYNAEWRKPASLAAIEGAYTGAAYAGFTEYAEVTVSSTGALSGQAASGCSYTGTVSPSNNGNFYSVSVTTQDAICAKGTTTSASNAYYSVATKTLYSSGLNGARNNGFIFV